MQTILVTGGAGYIGSHTASCLLAAGYRVVLNDNFSNSNERVVSHLQQIDTRWAADDMLTVERGDVRDIANLARVFAEQPIDAVIHFAGLKAVGESTRKPLEYYDNNVVGTVALLKAMKAARVRQLVFSSSATVYGADAPVPYLESMPLGQPSSPYGASKAIVERMLADLAAADNRWSITCLRYFNPIGAHPSGLIGEHPQGVPNNLLPYISQVAVGIREQLAVFGSDYETPDGTCVRDYLHVMDLAEGHLAALEHAASQTGLQVFNLGTGSGVSVLEMVQAFEGTTGQKISYRIESRRAGDLPAFWADASRAQAQLGWSAKRDLQEMIEDTWRWQTRFPRGYEGSASPSA